MKVFKKIIIPIVLMVLFIPSIVNAASSSISVSAASTGVVGNNLKVTVTISNPKALGSWDLDVKYNSEFLQLSSVGDSADCGSSTSCHGYVENASTKSKSYTFNFKVKKSGSTTVSANGSVWDYNEEKSYPSGSKTISLKTQEEIEASYSKDAYLKSITVGEYKLSPEFNKETYNYEVEVENEVERVTIDAVKNDGNASVSGAGEKELKEGANKFEIVVTAQKGNSLTYTVTINRKELDPIKVTLDNKELTLVRRKDALPENLTGMAERTVSYEGEEIPALYSDITDITIVGVKNEEGTVYTYIFENGKITNPYIELSSNISGIVPLNVEENKDFKNYKIKEIEIEGLKIKAYVLKDDSKFAVIYALDASTNQKNYYTYDMSTKTIMLHNKELDDFYRDKLNIYQYIILGCIGFMIILLLIILFRKPSNKKGKKNEDKPELVEEIDLNEVEQEEPKKDKKKKRKLKDLLYEDDEEEEEPVEPTHPVEEHTGHTEQINNLLNRLEEDQKDNKKVSAPKGKVVKDDTFIKTRKINMDEIAEKQLTEIEEEPELSKRELRRLEKEEKRRAKKERKEQKKLLNRDEF